MQHPQQLELIEHHPQMPHATDCDASSSNRISNGFAIISFAKNAAQRLFDPLVDAPTEGHTQAGDYLLMRQAIH